MAFLKLKKYIFYAFLLCLWLPALVCNADIRGKFTDFPPAEINCDSYDKVFGADDSAYHVYHGDYKDGSCENRYCTDYAYELDSFYKKRYLKCSEDMKIKITDNLNLFFDEERKWLKACRLHVEKEEEFWNFVGQPGYTRAGAEKLMDEEAILFVAKEDIYQTIEKGNFSGKNWELLAACYKSSDSSDSFNYLDSNGTSGNYTSEDPSSGQSSSWYGDMASAFFSWNSTSWDDMKQQAVDYWQAMTQAAEKEGSPLEYLYKFMGFLADQGSRGNLALLALSVLPLASLGKLFAMGNLGPKLTLDIINSNLSNIAVVFKELPSGLAGIAGIGNGVKYTQAGTVAIKQALAGNPIASVISKHEIAHLLGASEVQAWKITSQAFSALSLGDKIRSLGTLSGVNTSFYWLLSKTLPTLNNTLLQAQYLFTKGITKNIWRGY